MKKGFTYKKAGVDIAKAEESLSRVKSLISETHNSNVLKNIGAFGGFYAFPTQDYKNPVLIASTDGVGTKIKVAIMMNRHNTVGQDLVNHCINDIAVCGATPLFFLDYFACGKLDKNVYEQIMQGFTQACKNALLPLIGGETAEMPDMYKPGDYDLAGTIVGVVEREKVIDGSQIQIGDVIIGVASNGLHTNGYSLARKILFQKYKIEDYVPEIENVLGDELLKIHLNYYPIIQEITSQFDVRGMAHITGGGLYKNTIRIIPEKMEPEFNWGAWEVPAIFRLIQEIGNVPEEDMRQTFNMGIGLVFIIPSHQQTALLSYVKKFKQNFYCIGEIVPQK